VIEDDELQALLRTQWKAPEPNIAMDWRIISAYKSVRPPSAWARFWMVRISVPAPVLIAVIVAIIGLFVWIRPGANPVMAPLPTLTTRVNAIGFEPLPDGEVRVVKASEVRK
jgi:hypothetical protein